MKSRGAAFVLLVSFACAALCVAATRAQDSPPPKLDGFWTLNAAKSRIAKHGPPHSDTLRIESTAEFIIFYESIGGADVIRTYNSDGKITPVARVEGGAIMAKAYWKKGALWIETFGVESAPSALGNEPNPRAPENPAPDFASSEHSVQRLTLSADGKTLTRDFGKGNDQFVYDQDQGKEKDQ
jgi:hypothetical protein